MNFNDWLDRVFRGIVTCKICKSKASPMYARWRKWKRIEHRSYTDWFGVLIPGFKHEEWFCENHRVNNWGEEVDDVQSEEAL